MKREIIDGNTAVAKASYKLSEMSFIYPITPSSQMAEICDELASNYVHNIFDEVLSITEMQSEAGAIGALHGSALSGTISTTFTSSQGLLLMLPNMYKIAGEMLPVVLNVASRSVASHSLNIFCDHSDVMSARQTGFAMLGSSTPQECYDFAVASFLTSMKTRIPFLHFFDGFRTSHELNTVCTFDDAELKSIYPFDALKEYKNRAISPNNPKQYGTNESQDIFFQGREKSNLAYSALPSELEKTFEQIKLLGGKEHHIMEYYGSPNAKYLICVMASGASVVKNFLQATNNDDYGLLKINLYRPFDKEYFLKLLPKSVEKIAVLDRTKEQGSLGEPLYLDICSAILESKKQIEVLGGRFGLGGKEFNPAMVKAVFQNMEQTNPKNHFTVGIDDDISKTSLPYEKNYAPISNDSEILILGIGSDGSVSSAKNYAKIVGEENKFVKAYFMYDSKKSGGLTRSYITISNQQIEKPYLSTNLDVIVVNNASYLFKFDIAKNLKQNGTLIINSPFENDLDFDEYVPNFVKKTIAEKNAKIYSINANKIATENNIDGKISNIMLMALIEKTEFANKKNAKEKCEEFIKKSLSQKGDDVVLCNIKAIGLVNNFVIEIKTKDEWKNISIAKIDEKLQKNTCFSQKNDDFLTKNNCYDDYYNNYIKPVLELNGDELPVSKVNMFGENQTGTSKFEKRNVANKIPVWKSEKCIQCGKCSFVCPHAVIRAKLLTEEELKNAPTTLKTKETLLNKNLQFCLEVSPEDCLACGLCENVCPTKALTLEPKQNNFDEVKQNFEWTKNINNEPKCKNTNLPPSPLTMQFAKPYFEFSGACAGCGETPYIKLLSQMFGKNLIIANATGCSSIYGGSAPTCPYAKDENGFGPAWANSLFEDNAEFGLGIEKANRFKREQFKNRISLNLQNFDDKHKTLLEKWLDNFENYEICEEIYLNLLKEKELLNKQFENMDTNKNEKDDDLKFLFDNLDNITPKTTWLVGGDGWAYDIDFGGLDHVFASGENINILVLDTELYSNTGGQMSKSTPVGATGKFCANGKKTNKKNLALSAMIHGDVYVAEICLGADMNQTIKAIKDAQQYNGVSLVIAYAPCINHGIDMSKNTERQIEAVKCGYWHLFRYNPELLTKGENPLILDSQKPNSNYKDFLLKERRFANYFEKTDDLTLFEKSEKNNNDFYETLLEIHKMYDNKK